MPNDKDRSWLDTLSDTPLNLGNYPGYAFKAAQFGGNALSNIAGSMSPVRFEDADGPSGEAGFHAQVPPMITETAGAWDRLFGKQDNWYDGPGEVYPGDMNADAATAALAFYGGNALNPLAVKPRGAIASGASREAAALHMDPASRLARAKEMGFDTDKVYYHGGPKGIEAFDVEATRRPHGPGVWLTDHSSYAGHMAGRDGEIYQVYARTKSPEVMDVAAEHKKLVEDGTFEARDDVSNYDKANELFGAYGVDSSVRDMLANGADSVKLNNFWDFDDYYPNNSSTALFIKDPSNIRSVNAAFDPARAGENGLLLSDNKPSIMGAALAGAEPRGSIASGIAREGATGPLRTYHGTFAGPFDEFNSGPWMSDKPDVAGHYAGTDMLGESWWPDSGTSRVYPLEIDPKNPYTFSGDIGEHEALRRLGVDPQTFSGTVSDAARDAGHDFLIYENVTQDLGPPHNQYRALQPNTVRSATTGETLFSDNKPSIMGSAVAGANREGVPTGNALAPRHPGDFQTPMPQQGGHLAADQPGQTPETFQGQQGPAGQGSIVSDPSLDAYYESLGLDPNGKLSKTIAESARDRDVGGPLSFEHLGVRITPYQMKNGSTAPESTTFYYDFIDEDHHTFGREAYPDHGDPLGGTSTVNMPLTREGIAAARAQYPGYVDTQNDYISILGGDRGFHGDDLNEMVIKKALVLGGAPFKKGETLFSDNKPSILGSAVATADQPQGITAYHGSPHDFDKFSLDKIGTGEGAQAYGHGLYFADNEGVAKDYRNRAGGTVQPSTGYNNIDRELAAVYGGDFAKFKEAIKALPDPSPQILAAIDDIERKGVPQFKPNGRMYEVRINADPNDFLDWDKPLSQQSEKVRSAVGGVLPPRPSELEYSLQLGPGYKGPSFKTREEAEAALKDWSDGQGLGYSINEPSYGRLTGNQLFDALGIRHPGNQSLYNIDNPVVSQKLKEAGIPGIRYLDGNSRADGAGSSNYVVFDDSLIDILKKYGLTGAVLGAGALGLTGTEASANEMPAPQYDPELEEILRRYEQ